MTSSEAELIIKQCKANAIPDDEIDYSEIPPITDFSGFKSMYPDPKYFKAKKELTSIRFDKSLLDYLKSKGKGWQTQVNDFLIQAHAQGLI